MRGFERYVEYLKDNPEGYWFKRKLYGWGWTPVKWQGWLVTLGFIAFIIWQSVLLAQIEEPSDTDIMLFFTLLVLCVALLIVICFRTGEPPAWQWGFPNKD